MSNRLKRVFSTVLCAAVMLTMTAVPGTAFAENTDGSEANVQKEVQSPDEQTPANENENEADAVASDQNEGEAETEDEAQTPEAATGEASVPAAVQTAANQMNSLIALYKFDGVTVSVTPADKWDKTTNTVTACKGTVELKAVIVNGTDGTYVYQWYKKKKGFDDRLKNETNSNFTPKKDGTYYVKVKLDGKIQILSKKSEPITVKFVEHNYKSVAAKAETCTENGNTEYWKCTNKKCGKLFADEDGTKTVTVEDVTLKATGHDLEATAQKDATCTETGMKAYWKCRKCQKLFSDENAVTEIESPEVIPANAHKMKRVDKHDATCTEDGHEEYWKCEECGYLSSDGEGRNEIINPVKISATGHDLGEWKVTKEATVQAKGIKERACRKCEYKETAEIPMLTADKNTDVKKAADKSAETGDDMNIALYGLLALAAAAGAAGTLYRRKTN